MCYAMKKIQKAVRVEFKSSEALPVLEVFIPRLARILRSIFLPVLLRRYLLNNTPLPGTTQACLFRDSYAPITGASLALYGLSTDSPKSNTTFVTKQNLPYQLLCDPKATLIKAIGMHKGGAGSGTSRGVVVVDKMGNCKVWEQGGVWVPLFSFSWLFDLLR